MAVREEMAQKFPIFYHNGGASDGIFVVYLQQTQKTVKQYSSLNESDSNDESEEEELFEIVLTDDESRRTEDGTGSNRVCDLAKNKKCDSLVKKHPFNKFFDQHCPFVQHWQLALSVQFSEENISGPMTCRS